MLMLCYSSKAPLSHFLLLLTLFPSFTPVLFLSLTPSPITPPYLLTAMPVSCHQVGSLHTTEHSDRQTHAVIPVHTPGEENGHTQTEAQSESVDTEVEKTSERSEANLAEDAPMAHG